MTPISPDTLIGTKKPIPDEVIEVVNRLLVSNKPSNQRNLRIFIDQEEVIRNLVALGFERQEIFKKNMLDFEDHYRGQGWKVVYDKPAYYESYTPYWIFSN